MQIPKKETVDLFGIKMEVFMLPSGAYWFSHEQVAKAIDVDYKLVSQYLESDEGREAIFPYEVIPTGNSSCLIPYDVAVAFWANQAFKQGNTKAQALMQSSIEDTLGNRFDASDWEECEIEITE